LNLVLIDTSSWVQFFRDGRAADAVSTLVENNSACISGVITAELLSGARTKRDFDSLRDLLDPLTFLSETKQVFSLAGELRYKMNRKGFTAGLPDAIIAATALHYDAGILTLDKHFNEIAKHVPIKLIFDY